MGAESHLDRAISPGNGPAPYLQRVWRRSVTGSLVLESYQFQTIVRERRASEFPQRLKAAEASEGQGLRGFVNSLKEDLGAVTAGVTLL
jgi:hypothetical protein